MILETIRQIKDLSPIEKFALSDEFWKDVVGESCYETDPKIIYKFSERFSEYEKNPKLSAPARRRWKNRFKQNKHR